MRSGCHAKSARRQNESNHATAAFVPTIPGQKEGNHNGPPAPIISEADPFAAA